MNWTEIEIPPLAILLLLVGTVFALTFVGIVASINEAKNAHEEFCADEGQEFAKASTIGNCKIVYCSEMKYDFCGARSSSIGSNFNTGLAVGMAIGR